MEKAVHLLLSNRTALYFSERRNPVIWPRVAQSWSWVTVVTARSPESTFCRAPIEMTNGT